MPTYVYECNGCGEQTELVQRVTDEPLKSCPECGESVRKLLFAPAIMFKGPGFHVNDYPKSGKGPAKDKADAGVSGGNGSGEDKSSTPAAASTASADSTAD